LRQLFERARPAPAPPPFATVTGDDPSAQIRRTYQAMLAWAAGQGLARAPGATPGEHLAAVSRARPEHGAALGVITAAYLRARYGAEPVAPSLAQQVAEAWEGVARGRLPGVALSSAAPKARPGKPQAEAGENPFKTG
jgi:hypothetical protein